MSVKVRKQIYIEPAHEAMLKQLSQATGLSEAELIREALDRHIRTLLTMKRSYSAWKDIERFIAERMKQGPLPGKRNWRREDLYDR